MNDMKLVAVLNKNLSEAPTGVALNALGHMAIGLGGLVAKAGKLDDLNLIDYQDASTTIHPSISYYPFIVLRGKSGEIRKLRQEALDARIFFTDFLSTMTIGTSDEQVAKTKETLEPDLEYFGICLFGNKATLDSLTRKFSIWK